MKKNENTISICPYCKNKCLYEYRVNGGQKILCLNCGQLFLDKVSEQLLHPMDQIVEMADDGVNGNGGVTKSKNKTG